MGPCRCRDKIYELIQRRSPFPLAEFYGDSSFIVRWTSSKRRVTKRRATGYTVVKRASMGRSRSLLLPFHRASCSPSSLDALSVVRCCGTRSQRCRPCSCTGHSAQPHFQSFEVESESLHPRRSTTTGTALSKLSTIPPYSSSQCSVYVCIFLSIQHPFISAFHLHCTHFICHS